MRDWFIVYRLPASKNGGIGGGYERVVAATAAGAIAKFVETHPEYDVVGVHLDAAQNTEGLGLPTGPDPTKVA
ncbi:MAG: hypothetical protein E6R03_18145 [Hyphomicrobiaceae bacterium]|nr:MAG: hypothetical protein E6R03_18145 [Hyphomicrobiaceae bacterium]